jgi:enamine deaminase RidA (YjgF/YER057c/UK114 family)
MYTFLSTLSLDPAGRQEDVNKEFLNPSDIYPPTAKFTQAIKVTGGTLVFCSGLVGYEPDMKIAAGDVVRQAEVAYDNLRKVMAAVGGGLEDVVKVTIFIGEDFTQRRDELREVRTRFFGDHAPASTLVQVAGFASHDYLIEIEAVAVLP